MSQWHIKRAVKTLRAGGVIAYPTEAVYGLGCDPFDEIAVHRLLAIKNRPVEKGLILIASDFEQVAWLLEPLTTAQTSILQNTWPGPVTFTIPCSARAPEWLRGRFHSLAVRVSDHPTVIDLCNEFGGALVSTSANVTGYQALRSSSAVMRRLGTQLDYVMPGAVGGRAGPSEIRDIANNAVLRDAV